MCHDYSEDSDRCASVKLFTIVGNKNKRTTVIADDSSPCGDWEQYKDEHCYKLFDGLRSYSDAEKVCSINNSSMVSIHYAEEQSFLSNYIFTKKKVVDNVWIGAKFVGNKLFQWEDHTPLAGGYSNWAAGSPKNHSDYCVQMNGDPDSVGKWVDEPCARKNLAVCQRLPLPSVRLLAEALIALKHNLQQTASELAYAKRTETKKELLEKLKKEIIPLGFTYVQLPKDKAPSELWPSMTWADISKDYEGVFFRVWAVMRPALDRYNTGMLPDWAQFTALWSNR
ncbi:chromatin-modulating protein mrc1 [Tyrophagus putrescentiae]|nr:chromatin-modulating protein mrc1 [Tyrophagus putrescentiae]